MTESSRLTKINDTDLIFASIVMLSILLIVFALAYAALISTAPLFYPAIYTLLATIGGVAVLFALFKFRRGRWIIRAAALLFCLEGTIAAATTVVDQRHHIATADANRQHTRYVNRFKNRFSFHPMLAGRPTADFRSDAFNHTEYNTRVTAQPADPFAPVVVTIGGSTTYDGKGDAHTWSSRLAVQANLNVINMGVLGYSSAENVVQTAFWAPEYSPRCAIYYLGWNDLRSVGVKDLKPDYGGFHLERQGMMLGVYPHSFKYYKPDYLEGSAIYAAILNWRRQELGAFLGRTFPWWRDTSNLGSPTVKADADALRFFTRNVETIIALNRLHGTKTILIPQVMNIDDETDDDKTKIWTPFVVNSALKRILSEYHQVLARFAAPDVLYLDRVLNADWQETHFVDQGHFTPEGSKQFADIISDPVSEYCRL